MTYHYVYKTVRPATGQYYIGKHSTNDINDGYQGSGTRVLALLNKGEHLITGIIKMCDTSDEALLCESLLVTATTITDPLCLNLKVGGSGGSVKGRVVSSHTRTRMSKARKGRVITTEHRQKISAGNTGKKRTLERKLQVSGENNPNFKGWYQTPKGKFTSSYTAAAAHQCSNETIRNRCKNPKFADYVFIPNTL